MRNRIIKRLIKRKIILLCIAIVGGMFGFIPHGFAASIDNGCSGRFVNPITDICWDCMFPMTLGSMTLFHGDTPDTDNPGNPVCLCKTDALPQIGLSVGFWEPARMVDVTRHPYCFVTLGGNVLGNWGNVTGAGDVGVGEAQTKHSFYEVHWYIYPLLSWLNIITDALCVDTGGFDVGYMTELDPTWRDEELSFAINPESSLFANLAAQAACSADCAAATTHLPLDTLYWCAGCQGSMYPLTGSVAAHVGGVQASVLLTERMGYKLHRMGLEWGTSGKEALCGNYVMPIQQKSQYRLQMVYPKALTSSKKGCNPYGRSTTLWQSGAEYPEKGEDFGYLIWRKRNCCVF